MNIMENNLKYISLHWNLVNQLYFLYTSRPIVYSYNSYDYFPPFTNVEMEAWWD